MRDPVAWRLVRHDHRPSRASNAACTRPSRRDAVAHPRAPRRLRHGPHSPAARLRERLGRTGCQVPGPRARRRRTPERFLRAVCRPRRFVAPRRRAPTPTRRGRPSRRCSPSSRARAAPGGRPVTFLFDEVLEFRTFENFPGLRHVLRDLVEGLVTSRRNRFVLTTPVRHPRAAVPPRSVRTRSSDRADAADGRRAARRSLPAEPMASMPDLAARHPRAHRRPRRLRAGHGSRPWRSLGGADPDQRAGGRCSAPEAALTPRVTLLLRAAPAPRARLRRAQGHPRHPGGRGAADADRDRPAPAAHARARRRTTCPGSRTSTW